MFHDATGEEVGLADASGGAQPNYPCCRWGRGAWKPVIFIHRHVDQQDLIALNIMADFCAVTSLHDGMNLVAKEFVASRIDEDGVLVLSAFTGAARELSDALIVNPFSVDDIAAAMHEAIIMPAQERRRRMTRMRRVVAENNVYRWAGKILMTLAEMLAGVRELPHHHACWPKPPRTPGRFKLRIMR